MPTQRYPFGKADHVTPAYAAAITVAIANSKTIIEPAILTGALTLNITPDAEQLEGDEIIVKIKATGTEVTTFGTGIDGIAITGVAGKTKTKTFVFDGTNFIAQNEQID